MLTIHYELGDARLKAQLQEDWGELVAKHLHFQSGFTLIAWHEQQVVGLISAYWLELPPPLTAAFEGYIDIIEVRPNCRRQGVASHLLALAAQRAREEGAYQLRAWSSEDKHEAIPMWRRLGFGLCPATVYAKDHEVRGYFATRVLKEP